MLRWPKKLKARRRCIVCSGEDTIEQVKIDAANLPMCSVCNCGVRMRFSDLCELHYREVYGVEEK